MLCGRDPRPVWQRRLHPPPERRAGRVAPRPRRGSASPRASPSASSSAWTQLSETDVDDRPVAFNLRRWLRGHRKRGRRQPRHRRALPGPAEMSVSLSPGRHSPTGTWVPVPAPTTPILITDANTQPRSGGPRPPISSRSPAPVPPTRPPPHPTDRDSTPTTASARPGPDSCGRFGETVFNRPVGPGFGGAAVAGA